MQIQLSTIRHELVGGWASWLLALPASFLPVAVPLLAVQATGNSAWLPDFPGLCCLLVALACLAHRIALARRLPARLAPDHCEPGGTAGAAAQKSLTTVLSASGQ